MKPKIDFREKPVTLKTGSLQRSRNLISNRL